VTAAAFSRASCELVELSVGKESLTVGLLRTKPAATLELSSSMKLSRSGGQEQGIKTGWPFAPLMPSQLPVPLGFWPAVTPNSGTSAASTSVVFDEVVALPLTPAFALGVGVVPVALDADEDALTETGVGEGELGGLQSPASVVALPLTPVLALEVGAAPVALDADEDAFTETGVGVAGEEPSASICFWSAPQVVADWGHPTPEPLRFWSVTVAVSRRASWEAVELSVGKETFTEGFFRTKPAATFAFNCEINVSRSGGHTQGIRIGWPLIPLIPSQLPDPLGSTPA